jgi:hypothetical protein
MSKEPSTTPIDDNYSHDRSYKEIFSYSELVQQLIEGFVPPELVQLMDFSTLTNVRDNYITPKGDERHDDVVWKVKIGDQYLYLFILLEFQSTPDARMPVRMLQYVASLYDMLIKAEEIDPKDLPPVFPLVLYNGDTRWKIDTNLNNLIDCPAILKPYQPSLTYYLLDEGAFSADLLDDINNVVSGIFFIENAKTDEQAKAAVNRIVQAVNKIPNKQLIDRMIAHWVMRYLKYKRPDVIIDDIELTEDTSMLATNVDKWFESAELRGEGNGMIKAIGEMFRVYFPYADFGLYMPHLADMTEAKLSSYIRRMTTAKTPEEVFADDDLSEQHEKK